MDDQKLWNLLGHSPRPAAPPFFAAKVMRRLEAAESLPFPIAAVLRWFAPAAVAGLVLLAIVSHPAAESAPVVASDLTTLDLVQLLSPEDYETLTAAGWPYNNGFLSAGL
jgi:hypothetical protein